MGLRGGPKVGLDFHGKGWITDARRLLPLSYPSAFFFSRLPPRRPLMLGKPPAFRRTRNKKSLANGRWHVKGLKAQESPRTGGRGGTRYAITRPKMTLLGAGGNTSGHRGRLQAAWDVRVCGLSRGGRVQGPLEDPKTG